MAATVVSTMLLSALTGCGTPQQPAKPTKAPKSYGMIAGYTSPRIDNLVMRIVDGIYGYPTLILIILPSVPHHDNGHLPTQKREKLEATRHLVLGADENYEWDRAFIVRREATEALNYV